MLRQTLPMNHSSKGQRVGYVRVSSLDQNTARQLEGMELERIFEEKLSGKDTARPQLEAMLAYLREGDTLVVHSMDRLSRNLDDLRSLVAQLTRKGVKVEFVKENLSFSGEASPMSQLMLSVMGAFAEFESASAKALLSLVLRTACANQPPQGVEHFAQVMLYMLALRGIGPHQRQIRHHELPLIVTYVTRIALL